MAFLEFVFSPHLDLFWRIRSRRIIIHQSKVSRLCYPNQGQPRTWNVNQLLKIEVYPHRNVWSEVGTPKKGVLLPCTVPLLGFHNAILVCVCVIQIEESPSSHLRVFFEYFSSFLSVFSFKNSASLGWERGTPPASYLLFFSFLLSFFLYTFSRCLTPSSQLTMYRPQAIQVFF